VRELKYVVFRELLKHTPEERNDSAKFTVNLSDKLSKEELVQKYTLWLTDTLGKPSLVQQFLGISAPTYYRIINRKK